MNRKTAKGYLFAVLSAIIYGCMPLMASHIYTDGSNPMTLVFLRSFFSLGPLAALAWMEQRTLKIPWKLLPHVSLIGLLGCCITPMLLFSSYRFIASGTATIIHYVYPAVVVIAEMIFLRNRNQRRNLLSVALCIAGIGCFYSPGQALNLTGSALALLSGITFASYVVLLSHFRKHGISGFLLCFYVTAVSCAASLIICLAAGQMAFPNSLLGWGLCVLFSLLVTTGAVALFQKSVFLIGSERTSILSTLEPITSVVIGVVLLGEPLGARVIIGSLLVIAASILIAVFDIRKN